MKSLSLLLALAPLFATSPVPAMDSAEASPALATLASDSRTAVIGGFETHEWTLTLAGGREALVVVEGDGDSDLDAYLFDEFGNLADFDDDLTDYCILSVCPIWTGTFTLRIVNRGASANLYVARVD